jgi:signal recognition particle GTPase
MKNNATIVEDLDDMLIHADIMIDVIMDMMEELDVMDLENNPHKNEVGSLDIALSNARRARDSILKTKSSIQKEK